jgi:prepilin-type processing-associated H-X9-DG protein
MKDLLDGTTYVFLIGETKYFTHQDGTASNAYLSWDSSFRNTASGYSPAPVGVCAARNGINSSTSDAARTAYTTTLVDATTTFGSQHQGGASFAMADGAVVFLNESMSVSIYRNLGQRASGANKQGYQ